MKIAADKCIYTSHQFIMEKVVWIIDFLNVLKTLIFLLHTIYAII